VQESDLYWRAERMAKSNSFDVVSKTDLNEVRNAVHQVMKEVRTRFDFKGSASTVELEDRALVVISDDDYKLRSLTEILEQKLVKRGVSLKALSYGRVEESSGGKVRQEISIQDGIPIEKAREVNKFVRNLKLKVQASIDGDMVRISGRDRDTLQVVIRELKEEDWGIDMHFTNFRSS
jgi:uncharacterized protein YajQ (UPF0234 family)